MDWANWKIYLVVAILVAVVILILWYRCPTVDYERLPGRPDSLRHLAPDPCLGSSNPSTFCELPGITTKWGCNYDTTIYDVNDVYFSLVYIGIDGDHSINKNINYETDNLTITNNEAFFYYTYSYDPPDIPYGDYTLKMQSFVPNAPESRAGDCSARRRGHPSCVCAQPVTLLSGQYNSVSNISLPNGVTYYLGLTNSPMIEVSWPPVDCSGSFT